MTSSSKKDEHTVKILKRELKKEFLDVDDMQMNNSRVLDILQQLEAVNVDTKLLKSTKIGKVVNKLRSNTKINSISEMCSRLIAKWKAAARREASSTTAPKVKTEVPASSATFKTEVPASTTTVKTEDPTSIKTNGSTKQTKPAIKTPPYVDKPNIIPDRVDKSRVRVELSPKTSDGPVVYWMSRDQRVHDNWALLYAQQEAQKRNVPFAVIFSLVPKYLKASIRMYGFMLRGLQDVQEACLELNIPFHLLIGYPQDTIPVFVDKYKISLVVTDMSPLRTGIEWRNHVCDEIRNTDCGLTVVDAHNICPVWNISDKVEYGARTLRSRINKVLDYYLTGFPPVERQDPQLAASVFGENWKKSTEVNWVEVKDSLEVDRSIKEVTWCVGGEHAARDNLNKFLNNRLRLYEKRNDPTINGLSNISPWLHFGNIASQRCVLEAKKYSRSNNEAVKSFVEEIVVRKELSDNFCYYNPDGYDRLNGLYPKYDNNSWAQKSLQEHVSISVMKLFIKFYALSNFIIYST